MNMSLGRRFSLGIVLIVAGAALPFGAFAEKRETRKPQLFNVSVRGVKKRIATLKAEAKRRQRQEQAETPVRHEKAGEHQTAEQRHQEEEEAGTDFWEAYLYFLEQRAYPNDRIDWNAYTQAIAQRDAMPGAQFGGRERSVIGGSWEFVGPRNTGVPYRIYYGLGPLSGRVNAVAYDPTNGNTYYVGAAGGGVWKTTNGGVNWTFLSQDWQAQQVSSLAVHPTNPLIVYAGTGDFNGGGGLGFGVMKSLDGGQTWTNQGRAQFGTFAVSAIVIDPENPQIVTVTTGGAPDGWGFVWRSINGGATWAQVIGTFSYWSDLAIGARAANGTRYLYAAGKYDGGQVWRSADRGATWTKLAPPITNVNWFDHYSMEIATSPSYPSTVYLLCGYDRKVLKSVDAGATWTNITAGFPNGNGNYNWSQASYDATIECSTRLVANVPTDVIYVGLIDQVMSRDGGATWQALGRSYTDTSLLHNDQHCCTVNPLNPNETLVGCDGGVYRLLYNPAANTWAYTSLNANLGITQFYKLAVHPSDANRLLGGAQDNASPVARGSLSTWQNVTGGDGGFCAIFDANRQYGSAQFLFLYKTTNGWTNSSVIAPDTGSDRVAFIAPITLSPDGNSLYAASNYLYRRNETTNTWANRLGSQSLSASGEVEIIAVAPSDGNRIYTGSSRGEVWMTTNGGTSWAPIHTGTPNLPDRVVTSISVHPTNPSAILVGVSGTGSGHIWRCNDTTAASRVWTNISGTGVTGLPDIPLNAIVRDPDAPTATFYVGMDVGVFTTNDSGATWANATLPLGLPNVQVNDLKFASGLRYLYAGTYGRGIWRITIPSAAVRIVSGQVTPEGAVNKAQPVTFTFRPIPSGAEFSRTVTLAANGSFSLTNIPSGNYNVAIKGYKWLRDTVAVNASAGNVSGVTALLLAGDATDDNIVDVNDLSAYIAAFDAMPGDPNWNPDADFDCNGIVDVDDLSLLIRNFDKEGDA